PRTRSSSGWRSCRAFTTPLTAEPNTGSGGALAGARRTRPAGCPTTWGLPCRALGGRGMIREVDERELLTERFERHKPYLRDVAYRMLGSVSEAEDALQEAWLRVRDE